jgi:hypothetical protein
MPMIFEFFKILFGPTAGTWDETALLASALAGAQLRRPIRYYNDSPPKKKKAENMYAYLVLYLHPLFCE